MVESKSYKEVLDQLRIFVRKFYLNKMLQGLLITLLVSIISLGILILSNQGFKLGVDWRTISFMIFAGSMVLLAVLVVIIPFVQYLGIGRKLNYRKAERIITAHFSDIKDTLLNLLELAEDVDKDGDNSLLVASIEDKASRIKWYRFTSAVPLKRLLRYTPYYITLIILGSVLYFAWPDFVKEGYARTVNYKTDFDLPPVYNYNVLNDSLVVALGRDIEIRVKPLFDTGEENVYLRLGQNREVMRESDQGELVHVIRALNNNTSFRLQYNGILSEPYMITVLPTPELVQFTVQYFPPAYTQIEGKVLNNQGDLDIPYGTRVMWNINAMHTDESLILFAQDTLLTEKNNNSFSAQKRILESGRYRIAISNNQTEESPELGYSIRVRPDLYPEIDVNEIRDSLIETQYFYQGFISDDYGFTKLEFNVEKMDGSSILKEDMHVNRKGTSMRFYHAKDLSEIGHEGEQLYYYFSVWDNDGVDGAKRTDSKKMAYRNLTYTELVEQNKERAENIEEKLNEGKDITEKLKDKVEEMKMSQLTEEREDWEVRSKLKEMEEMQRLLDEMINNIKEENRISGVEQNKFDMESERLIQKQEEIQELLEDLMDEELRELLEEFEKLVEESNKGQKLEKLEEIDLSLENLERQLDVSLELLKRYEVEKEVFRMANELEKMASEMERLDVEEDSDRMKEMKEEFNNLNENYQEQLEKNQELKDPMPMEEFEKEREDIEKEMEEMNNSDEKKSKRQEKKKGAEEKMKELGEKMKGMMMGGNEEQEMVDIETLRQLARELNDFSFKQEDLIEIVRRVNANHPEYARAGVEQRELKEKFSVVKDSLVSIGYKAPKVAQLLNKEMFHVETALENLMKSYQDGNKNQLSIDQQNIMTGANELAVRLDEIIQSSQQQNGQGGGKSNFTDSKPKSGEEKVGEMKQQQQSLKEQLEGMINQMKAGNKGKRDKKGLAKMLAEREMMRQAMEKLKNSGELGEKTKGKLSEAQKLMEEVEKDIIYDRLGDHTIRREKMIESKLLEAEQAEMEREMEDKRESREYKGTIKPPDQKIWEEFEQQKKKTLELMKYRDIKLKEFYRKKYYDYLDQLEKQKK